MPPTRDLGRLIDAYDGSGLRFWREVIDTMHDALVIVGPEKQIYYMNPSARQLCGREVEEVRGRDCLDVINCPNCACDCRLFSDGVVRDLTVELYTPAGERKYVLKNATVLRDSQGEIIGGIEVLKDITKEVQERREREKKEEQLALEKRRSEAMLDSLSEGVFTLDVELNIKSSSRRVAEITGYSVEQLGGANFRTLFQLDEDATFPAAASELAGQRRQLLLRTRSGDLRRLEFRFQRCRYGSGEILGIVEQLRVDRGSRGRGDEFQDFQGMLSVSNRMMEVFRFVEKAADTDANILLHGETGTGKELLARALHYLSHRRNSPFRAINCAMLRGELLLSSLFGHEKGAFTGASERKQGKLEAVGHGTLFLDEVHEIPIEHQSLLLRVLDERSFERVGGNQRVPMNARIICATNLDLAEAVEAGRFRRDLYYRINVFPIAVPPLRERNEDVSLLVRYFLSEKARDLGEKPKLCSADVFRALREHTWPGNIRELKNVVEYLHFVSDDHIELSHLPETIAPRWAADQQPANGAGGGGAPAAGEQDERSEVLEALKRARFNKAAAARELGVNRTTLWRKMKRLGIEG